MKDIFELGRECGFTGVFPMSADTIELREDVRSMCASGKCARWNACWSCPPACGDLESCRATVRAFKNGVLVQTTGTLEDAFDGEGMMEAEAQHKEHFSKMHKALREMGITVLALGAGSCTRCKRCTYPDAPCRFPDEMTSSMEAFGMLVQHVCAQNDVKYYYGPNTITYTGCFLLKD